ncbi:MAG: hypothetical protein ABUT20_21960 [Bacteroidota bacterium]
MNTFYFLPVAEKKHFIECPLCHDFVNMRNLSEVYYHDSGDCQAGFSGEETFHSVSVVQHKADDCRNMDNIARLNLRSTNFLSYSSGVIGNL